MRILLAAFGVVIVVRAVASLRSARNPMPDVARSALASRGFDTGRSMTSFTRGFIPGIAFFLWVGLVMLAIGVWQPGLGAISILIASLALPAANFALVVRTGRPRFQIPTVWRSKTEGELLAWLDSDIVADARVRNPDSIVKLPRMLSPQLVRGVSNRGPVGPIERSPDVDFEERRQSIRF